LIEGSGGSAEIRLDADALQILTAMCGSQFNKCLAFLSSRQDNSSTVHVMDVIQNTPARNRFLLQEFRRIVPIIGEQVDQDPSQRFAIESYELNDGKLHRLYTIYTFDAIGKLLGLIRCCSGDSEDIDENCEKPRLLKADKYQEVRLRKLSIDPAPLSDDANEEARRHVELLAKIIKERGIEPLPPSHPYAVLSGRRWRASGDDDSPTR